jgi:hypothetical protein
LGYLLRKKFIGSRSVGSHAARRAPIVPDTVMSGRRMRPVVRVTQTASSPNVGLIADERGN